MKAFRIVAAGATLGLALSACGSDLADGGLGAGGDEATDVKCSEIWVTGETLNAGYVGFCQEGDTELDAAHTPCADGKRRMFIHQTESGKNTHVAITGEEIKDFTEDVRSALYEECQPSE